MNPSRAELAALLNWYRQAGVDLAVAEAPEDRFAASAPRVPVRPLAMSAAPSEPAATQSAGPADADPESARALAASATTLEALRAQLDNYEGCGLRLRATQLVFGDGNPHADIMLVGEAPGRDEDIQGKPFVGRSGQLLDKMLAAIDLDRTQVYIANTVPWRPPGNRTPTPPEMGVCLPFLHRQIELVAPRILVTLGAAATGTIFGAPLSILKARGKWRELEIAGLLLKVMPTLHPAFLLRQPAQKLQAWRDMLALRAAFDQLNPGGSPAK